MLKINKYVFYKICNKDIDKYNDIVLTIKSEYSMLINQIKIVNNCTDVRIIVHKLVGIVSIFHDTNEEINYILKSMLNIPKSTNNFNLYKGYIDMLLTYDKNKLF
jgi:hypothetical protein